MTTTIHDLQATLGGQLIDAYGDARLLIGGDVIYCSTIGAKVKVDHGGRIHTLGSMHDDVDALAAAFVAATRRAAS